MSKFKQHGAFKAELIGRVIVFRGTGPWNLESVEAAAKQFINLSESLYDKPWGTVGFLYGQPVHVPEATKKLVEIVKQEKQRGRVATGIITRHCDFPAMAQQHLGEIYTKGGEPHEFFDNLDDALAWVNSRIKSQGNSAPA